jgi:tetratricopeptide (TPR) repeat protein
MHHYCDGLRFYQRAMRDRNDPPGLKFNINNATTNYDYILVHTSPGFHMRPEVLVMKGQLLELASKTLEAAQLYNEALKLDPKFSMAYGALGNFYAKTGSKDQALKVYTEGLKRNPRNRYLLARYKALGGRSAEISQ